MTDLDALGRRHRKLQADLAEVREQLAPAMREARKAGATLVDVMNRSGYASVETVRQILDPAVRGQANTRRRERPAGTP